jgi:hypothetical protein
MVGTKAMQDREHFAVAALMSGVERRAEFLWCGHVNKSPLRIDGGVPTTVCLIDADPDE